MRVGASRIDEKPETIAPAGGKAGLIVCPRKIGFSCPDRDDSGTVSVSIEGLVDTRNSPVLWTCSRGKLWVLA